MNIYVAVKVVPDDADIAVAADRTLDYSKARPTVSTYDLNAIEAGAQLAAQLGAKLIAITVGDESVKDAKNAKNILARGVDELVTVADPAYKGLDARATAAVLAAALEKRGDADLILCGDGSADLYAQQVDVQLACAMGLPVVNGACKIQVEGDHAVVERLLETEKEIVEVSLPAVISVVPDIALPRVCGMKDILAAGKKPIDVLGSADVEVQVEPGVEVVDVLAPEPADRKRIVYRITEDGDLDKFVAALADAIK